MGIPVGRVAVSAALVVAAAGVGTAASARIRNPVPACAAVRSAVAPPSRARVHAEAPTSAPVDFGLLMDQINTIALERFPGSVTRLEVTGPRTLVIYEPRHDPAFFGVVAALPGYDQLTVIEKHDDATWADLNALTMRIADDSATLERLGVHMARWGPGVGRVHVVLSAGTCRGSAVMPPALVRQAQRVFDRRYGAGHVVVDPIGQEIPVTR